MLSNEIDNLFRFSAERILFDIIAEATINEQKKKTYYVDFDVRGLGETIDKIP